jgi:hypothetical protein
MAHKMNRLPLHGRLTVLAARPGMCPSAQRQNPIRELARVDKEQALFELETQARGNLEYAIRPQVEHLRMNYDASTRFAEQAIKSGFLLNGGAIVVLSGFAALFKVDTASATARLGLVSTALAFIFGLVAACITCFFAYRSAKRSVDVANHRLAGTVLSHLNRKAGTDALKEPTVKAQYDAASAQESQATRDTICALIVGVIGLVAFVFGALLGAWTLISFPAAS